MRFKYSALAAAVALALGSSVVSAADGDDMFSLRGYGTLGAVYSTQQDGDYVHDMYSQNEGVGRTDSVSAALDSRTALQLNAEFTDRFSAVVQLVSEAVYNNSWDDKAQKLWQPSLEWANLSYRVTGDLTVRAGRIVSPFLMNAEFQKVGYANHWMRTPAEVYGRPPYTSVDGGDITFKHAFGSVTNTIRGYYGTQDIRRPDRLVSGDATSYGVIDTVEAGGLTLRAAYVRGSLEVLNDMRDLMTDLQAMENVYRAIGATDAANAVGRLVVANTPGFEDKTRYYALGASYDAGNWFAMGEALKTEGGDLSFRSKSAYVSGGLRINSWTPYATIALTEAKPWTGYIPTTGLPQSVPGIPGFSPLGLAQSINDGLRFVGDLSQDQGTTSVGVRWDVYKNIAVKAQYDYIMLSGRSTGMFVNRTADFEEGKDASLFGLSVDFVF